MRFCLSFLTVFILSLFFSSLSFNVNVNALSTSAVIADVTTHIPPPHKHAVSNCNAASCAGGSIAVTNLASDGGWMPLATATVTVNAPAGGMKGFLIYAAAPNGKHVGTFQVNQGNAQFFDSATPAASTLQHVNNQTQSKIVATWTAPAGSGTPTAFTFTALIMQNAGAGAIVQQVVQQTKAAQTVTTTPKPTTTTAKPKTAAPTTTTTTAAAVFNCFLTVPNNALTAQGLATPYILSKDPTGNQPCTMANPNTQAFVQGAIIDQATGKISIYNPLVITAGTQPAIKPTVPTLPAQAIVALWFGFNGGLLTLKNAPGTKSVTQANCVNGIANSVFSQFAYCNAVNFFNTVQNAIENGQIATAMNAAAIKAMTNNALPTVIVPALGTAIDGKPCPTLRDFFLVDMDQSDNLDVTYLVTANGQTAQATTANAAALAKQNAVTAINPGDNALLTTLVNPAIKCTGGQLTAPDLANNNAPVNALPLQEIQAMLLQGFPQARVPALDPMVLDGNGNQNLQKLTNFRLGVFQAPPATLAGANTACYCKNMAQVAPARLMKLNASLALSNSFVAGQNLFVFLVTRFNAAVGAGGLNCAQFGVNTQAFAIANPNFTPSGERKRFHSEAYPNEKHYVWYNVPGSPGVIRMHVLDVNNDTSSVTVDTNVISDYSNLDMTSTLENMDHNNALGLEMEIYSDPNLINAITDPGTQTADSMNTGDSTTPFFSSTTGIAVIIAIAVGVAIIIIGSGAYCYLKKRKQHTNTVTTMTMASV